MDLELKSINKLNIGSLIYYEDTDKVYKITDLKISKAGKHGHAKANIRMSEFFPVVPKNKVIVKPVNHKLQTPILKKYEGVISSIIGEKIKIISLSPETLYCEYIIDLDHRIEGKNLKENNEVRFFYFRGLVKIFEVVK